MEYRILGSVEVLREGASVPLGGAKPRALLAVLLLHPNEVVSAARLVDELWGERPPMSAGKIVQQYVSQLRKAVGSALVTRAPGYLIQVETDEIDASRFQQLLAEARSVAAGQPAEAAPLYAAALALWRGLALTGLEVAGFARNEADRLDGLRVAALEERFAVELALGRAGELVPELEALVASEPLRERPRGQLMLALSRSGRRAEALELYRQTRRLMVDELGLEPGEALRDLERRILQDDPSAVAPRSAGGSVSRPLPELPAERGTGRLTSADAGPAGQAAAPTPRWPGVRSWRVAAPVVLFVLVASGVAAFRGLVAGKTATAGRIEGRIPVPLPGGPWVGRVAFGAGSLWIRKSGDDEVLRVAPATGRVLARIRVGFAYDTGIAALGRDVWVTNGEGGTVSRISTVDNKVVATIPVANHHSGSVSRIDPRLNRVVKTVPISSASLLGGPKAIGLAGGQLWVADAGAGDVVRVDPRRDRRVEAIGGSGPACGGMAASGGSVWIASACNASKVTRIDARTARVTRQIPVPGVALDVAAGFGSIWVTTMRGLLLRIDPGTNEIVARLRLRDAVWMTAGGGFVWVLSRVDRSVIRVRPTD
jgi:DNA-binding SARP family transcriptional activator/sugar lactone lactonase YvrE